MKSFINLFIFVFKRLEIEENTFFNKGEDTVWICLNCGHIHVGAQAPEECPVCAHARAYFQELKDHYE